MKKFLLIYLSAIVVCFLFEYLKITRFEMPVATWNEPYPTICPAHLDSSKVPLTLTEYKQIKNEYSDLHSYPIIYIDTTKNNMEIIQKSEPFKSWGAPKSLVIGKIKYDEKGKLEAFAPQSIEQKSPKAEFTCWYDKSGNLDRTEVETDISYLVYDANNQLKLIRDIRR